MEAEEATKKSKTSSAARSPSRRSNKETVDSEEQQDRQDPKNPFKRITFRVANEDFVKFVGHKPTPEPLERLFDTTTLVRMFALRNADGTRKRIFVWRSWMWMPAALLVAASFIVGGYLAMKPNKSNSAHAATSTTAISEPIAQSAPFHDDVRQAPTAETVNTSEARPVATVTAPTQPRIAAEAAPRAKSLPKSDPKRDRRPTVKTPSTDKPNGDPPSTPFAATPFTPVE